MEKYKKKDMLLAVSTLLRANDAIVKTAISNPRGAAEALVQCQESAIALGSYIDTLDEKYVNLVHILEEYCENIYQMSESLPDENVCRKVSKKIQKQLMLLQNGIKYDMPDDKKEVVFLPYKASMWDSLESVWKAAEADPNCVAYVIPIPYFDKNPDGSFKAEHYEGDQYPPNVPITKYDEYDLEERRPDAIYIHNPYDECNHVTSVHPYFYSKNLRNFTDRLVYIPYFVLNEIEPDDQAAIEGMKHFCFTPGTIYANRVVVQSENMRQIYINEYMKAAKEMGLTGEHVDRKFLEKKFLGIGSPKFDRVQNTKKENLEIPAEWMKVIEKPDGSWKKIVFYNTSVGALLLHDDNMLKKMESVFEIFKENKDEVAILWRPHPLIQATIESMRPQLWEAYKELRDRYIAEGWGIYDDSADLDRAVVISDAYYGDSSSVVQLYRQTCKPVWIQDVALQYGVIRRRMEKIYLYNYINKNNRLYCKSGFLRGILVEDKEKGFLLIGDEKFYYGGLAIVEYNNKIYFPPMESGCIEVFDIEEEQVDIVKLPRDEYYFQPNKFYNSVVFNNKIYIFPGQYPYIVEYSPENKKIIRHKIDKQFLGSGDNIFSETMSVSGKKVYLALWDIRGIMVADLDNKSIKYTYYLTSKKEGGYRTICMGNSGLYVSDNNGNILSLCSNSGQYKEQKIYSKPNAIYRKSIQWDNFILFFDNNSYNVLVLDEKEKIIKEISLDIANDLPNEYGFPKIVDEHLEIFDCGRELLIWLNKDMQIIKETSFSVCEVKINGRSSKKLSKDIINEYICLNEYSKNKSENGKANGYISGEKIFQIF